MAKKVTRKELLKKPDEFITLSGKMILWATDNRKSIATAIGIVVAAALVLGLVGIFKNRAENKAFAALNQANEKYASALTPDDDPKKALKEVETDFENIVKEYSGYMGGRIARVEFANYCYEAGEYGKAAGLYEAALADFGDDPSYRNFLLSGLGRAYEAVENYESAEKYFQMLAESDAPVLKDEGLFSLARIYEDQGKNEKSVEALEKLSSDFPDSIYIEMVKEKLKG